MLDSVLRKLEGLSLSYLSIGISKEGESYNAIPVPWERTVSAMNMKLPRVYFTPEEIQDPETLDYLTAHAHVIGCYIFTPLANYDFLARFPDIWDLEIRCGKNLTSLEFMRGMSEWKMLYVEDAHLDSLDAAFPSDRGPTFGLCLSLLACEVTDISALTAFRYPLSELVIFREPAQENERSRWKPVRANTYRYYTLQPK